MPINIQVPKCERSSGLAPLSFMLIVGLLNSNATVGEAAPDDTKQVERGQMIY